MSKLKALDLFSGVGGISLALSEYAEAVAYCEIEPYCRAVLTERMQDNDLDTATIFPDITKLNREQLSANGVNSIDIICGGLPCQDISSAGRGEGLEGKRSGLFFEVCRLVKEIHLMNTQKAYEVANTLSCDVATKDAVKKIIEALTGEKPARRKLEVPMEEASQQGILKFDLTDLDAAEAFKMAATAPDAYGALFEIGQEIFRPARKHGYADLELDKLLKGPHGEAIAEAIGTLEKIFYEILDRRNITDLG